MWKPAGVDVDGSVNMYDCCIQPCNGSVSHTPPLPPHLISNQIQRRDERKRSEEALARAVSEHETREKRLMEEAKQEKEAQRKAFDKQVCVVLSVLGVSREDLTWMYPHFLHTDRGPPGAVRDGSGGLEGGHRRALPPRAL